MGDQKTEAPESDVGLAVTRAEGRSADDEPTLGFEETHRSPTFRLPTTTPREARAGDRRYRFLRGHAHGGLGEVSVALDEELGREVALKELSERHAKIPQLKQRFLLEAKVTGGLEHPGIVPIYGMGIYPDGRPYYAMRLIRGDSLAQAIEALHRPKTPHSFEGFRALRRRLVRRFIGVCEAIAYAHSRGVLHRDLKPANIMLGPYGETLVVDWGLAKIADPPGSPGAPETRSDPDSNPETLLSAHDEAHPTHTVAGSTLGTPAFMSPEQARGEHDRLGPASDIFGLGATLYHLITGALPYAESSGPGLMVSDDPIGAEHDTETGAMARARRADFPSPRGLDRSIPPALESICLRAMAREPSARYASAQAMAEDLERWLAGDRVRAHHESLLERTRRALQQRRALFLVGAAAFAVSIAVALAAQQRIDTLTHPPLEQRLVDAGLILLTREDPREAELLFREAHRIDENRHRGDLADRIGATIGLGLALADQGRFDEAVATIRPTVESRRGRLGPRDLLTASAENALGEVLLEQGKLAQARTLLERSFVILERARDERPRLYRWAHARRTRLREKIGRPEHGQLLSPGPTER